MPKVVGKCFAHLVFVLAACLTHNLRICIINISISLPAAVTKMLLGLLKFVETDAKFYPSYVSSHSQFIKHGGG